MTTSIPPTRSGGGGNAKYAIVGILLLLIAGFAIYFATRKTPPPETHATHAPPPIDAGPIGPTVGTQFAIPEEQDAGPDGAADAHVRIRYVTRYVSGNCRGAVDNEGVNAAARANIGGMRECYNRALRSNPALRGNVHARWIINPGGGVGEVSTSIGDSQFRSCFESALRRVHFPPPHGGCATADFSFPLTAN